jgi:hypothetical protein
VRNQPGRASSIARFSQLSVVTASSPRPAQRRIVFRASEVSDAAKGPVPQMSPITAAQVWSSMANRS